MLSHQPVDPAPPSEPPPRDPPAEEPVAEPWRWCPRCGHELHNHRCKLTCPRCNYFLSCSDFD